jgi:3-dehydroquinate synthase
MQDTRNIVLTGFMGTGKSTIGRLLAERLARPFVDMDATLVEQFGKPIAEVFAQEGEATFRVAEAQLCAQLAAQEGLVISTGGGALVNPQNRAALAATGILLCLTAGVDEILRRLDGLQDRPLLNDALGSDTAARARRVRAMLHERRHAYAAIPLQVETDGRAPETVVAAIVDAIAANAEAPGMQRIHVTHPQGTYDLCIGDGLLAHAGQLLAARGLQPGPVALVSNRAISLAHAPLLEESLRAAGFAPHLCLVPDGEQFKTLASVADLYDQFLDAHLDRRTAVIALGGGVVGDMAGFAAASYLRGVPFVQMPTSLLAMVDASVGGKTGVDLPQGKNLVGAFKQPEAVIIDTAVLETLPAAEFRSGMAEVVKHGIIAAPDLFAQLEESGPTTMAHMVAHAVRVKVRIVEEDPFEQGRRAVLNLGHTFGHALEQVSHYAIRHGEAVAVGMVAATQMAGAMGICQAQLLPRLERMLDRLGLPTRARAYDVNEIMAAMGHDKKRTGKTLRFVLPRAVGDVIVADSPGDDLVRAAVTYILTEADNG